MADASIKTKAIFFLKKCPGIFHIIKIICLYTKKGLINGFRTCGVGFRIGAPRGFFSGLDLLAKGEYQGRRLFCEQELPFLPKNSLIELAGCDQNGRQPWPVFWLKMNNVRLVGESLAPMDRKKNLMIEAVFGKEFGAMDPSYNYIYLQEPLNLKGSWTSIASRWGSGFYHWFNDALPRLAPLSEFRQETKILIRGELCAYQQESLEMLGLLDRVWETRSNHLLVENFYFSSSPGMTGCTNPYVANWLREKFLQHQTTIDTPKKFFIKRHKKTRGILNQDELENYFISLGWAVVDLESLHFAEQIAWFANAEAIVGEHGGGFTNLVWCRPGCRVIELCPDNFLNGCYEGISLCLRLNHTFITEIADEANRINIELKKIRLYVEKI
jgi:hypothetical protein